MTASFAGGLLILVIVVLFLAAAAYLLTSAADNPKIDHRLFNGMVLVTVLLALTGVLLIVAALVGFALGLMGVGR